MRGKLSALTRRVRVLTKRLVDTVSLARRGSFATPAPSPQNAVAAVPDFWASKFPPPLLDVAAGESDLFTDPRISWAFERLGGVEGKTVLDLGPLEGAHSYMAEMAGASRVVGVEANKKAFLKCLVTKEVFDLQRTSFLCGDVMPYLAETSEQFDVCIACGLLYHMVEPVRLIELISTSATSLVLWTHVYDDVVLERRDLAASFSPARAAAHPGETITFTAIGMAPSSGASSAAPRPTATGSRGKT